MSVVHRRPAAARPQLIRSLNEQVVLDHVRRSGPISRAELARRCGLSKPTVSLALAAIERTGLVHAAGQRTGVPGPAAVLYSVCPDAGLVLGLDVGRRCLRGELADLTGAVRSRRTVAASNGGGGAGRVAALAELAATLRSEAGVDRHQPTQTVIGSPGVYDAARDRLRLVGGLTGWGASDVPAALRAAFGPDLVLHNDIDAAALAEQAHGHGRQVASFAFVSIGTGIGMGLVLDGRLHRGARGVAGELGYLPFAEGLGAQARDARRRGAFDASVSAAAVVRAGRRSGLRGAGTAQRVFAAAADGDPRARAVVDQEALLVAKAVCTVASVVDPELVVLGGGIGQAPGFRAAVVARLARLAPLPPPVVVSALGSDAVVAGCVAAGLDAAWRRVVPAPE